MDYYTNELKALKRAGRYRTREIINNDILDFASNDYLGLSHNKKLHRLTCETLSNLPLHSSKASLLVNGYHQIHKDFEDALCEANGFEDGVILGSGFNANIALIESLVRKGDRLFMDEKYHASGILASNINGIDVVFFEHNNMEELQKLLEDSTAKRKIVAVEGIYSMDGDLVKKDIFEICDKSDAILIVDEAHSSGVVGDKLMGVFDYYNIPVKPNHIKMGTLGKAYGSFGAYILASSHIVDYLINRAKPIIYATSLSLYDTILGHNSLNYILENRESLKAEIKLRQKIIKDELGVKIEGLIAPILIDDNKKVVVIKEKLLKLNYSVGAIRQPTVSRAILRIIARLGESREELKKLCKIIKNELKSEENMKKRIFVTATNTDIGKTYTTKLLIKEFASRGLRVGVIKPIETGVVDGYAPDGENLLKTIKKYNDEFTNIELKDIVPITYELPASPFISSNNTALDFKKLDEAVEKLEKFCDVLIIEGAGGLYVPVDDKVMMIDLIEYFKATALLVTHCSLGCINDTILSKRALDERGISNIVAFNCRDSDESFRQISEPYFLDSDKKVLKVSKDIDTICDVLYNL